MHLCAHMLLIPCLGSIVLHHFIFLICILYVVPRSSVKSIPLYFFVFLPLYETRDDPVSPSAFLFQFLAVLGEQPACPLMAKICADMPLCTAFHWEDHYTAISLAPTDTTPCSRHSHLSKPLFYLFFL